MSTHYVWINWLHTNNIMNTSTIFVYAIILQGICNYCCHGSEIGQTTPQPIIHCQVGCVKLSCFSFEEKITLSNLFMWIVLCIWSFYNTVSLAECPIKWYTRNHIYKVKVSSQSWFLDILKLLSILLSWNWR